MKHIYIIETVFPLSIPKIIDALNLQLLKAHLYVIIRTKGRRWIVCNCRHPYLRAC